MSITKNEQLIDFFHVYCQFELDTRPGDKQMPEDMNLDRMVEFAKMCGASEARARDEMLEVLEFQKSLMDRVNLKRAFS